MLFAVLLLAACGSTSNDAPPVEPSDEAAPAAAADPVELFLDHPTLVRADVIQAIFPADLEKEIRVKGLSAGWRQEGGLKVWEGTGEVEVRVRNLVLAGSTVTVTLVTEQRDREILIQAVDHVSFDHDSGVGTAVRDKSLLSIRNEKWLVR